MDGIGEASRTAFAVARGASYFRNGSRPLETVRLTVFFGAGSVSWAVALKASPLIRIRPAVKSMPASRVVDVFVSCLVILVFTSSGASLLGLGAITWRVRSAWSGWD